MRIELTKEQLKEMLLAAMLYSFIRGGLADDKGEDFKKYEELENYLLKIAEENGFNDLVEKFHGHLIPSDELSELEEEIMSEYDDDALWSELITRLGRRDFFRTVTPDEDKEMKKRDWLPDRAQEFFDKYDKEFEKYGVERLEIKGN